MRKIVFLIILLLLVGLIFNFTKDKKIYYFTFSTDEKLYKSLEKIKKNKLYESDIKYIMCNYRTTDLLNDINNNIKINKNIPIKNALIKADIIFLKIGENDYINYIDDYEVLNNNLINLKNDMKNLLSTIRSISKEKIVLIGINNAKYKTKKTDELLRKLNEMYSNLAAEYNIYYLDIYDKLNITNSILDQTYEYIIEKLIKEMDNDIIN